MTRNHRQWGALLIGAALAVGVLAMGAVHTRAVGFMGVAALAAAVVSVLGRGLERARAPWAVAPFLVLGCAALSQLLPFPVFVHELLNPSGHDAFAQGWRALFDADAPATWRALSLDPWATADRALRWFTLALLALAAGNLGGRHTPSRVAVGVVALGAASVLAALARALIWPEDAHTYWGVVETIAPIPMLSTFINVNQGAALLGASALCAVWLASRATKGRWRAIWVAFALALGGVCVGLNSLGVWAALAATGVAWVMLSFGPRAALAAGGLCSFVGWLAWRVVGEAHMTSVSARASLYEAAAHASLDFWRFGAGAGAVDRVLVPYAPELLTMNDAPHVENEVLEWALTLGWPVTLAVVALFAVVVRATFLRGRASASSWSEPPREHAVSWLALVYVAALSMFHFPFFVIGLGAPLLVLYVSCVARKSSPRPRAAHAALGLGALGLLLSMYGALSSAPPSDAALASIEPPSRAVLQDRAAAIPSESMLYRGEARRVAALGRWERAVVLTERAWALEPRPKVRVALALALARSGAPDERVLALLSPMYGPNAPPQDSKLLDPLLASLPSVDRRAELFQAADEKLLGSVTRAIVARNGAVAVEEFLLELARLRPDDVLIHGALARLYQKSERPALAEFWLRVALSESPADGALHVALIRALAAQGRQVEADAHLWSTLSRAPDLDELQPFVLAWWLRHMFDDLALTGARVDAIERASARVCAGAMAARNARACDVFPAWSLERSGDLDAARARYDRSARIADDPSHLAEFLLRHERCLELRRLLVSWRPRDAKRAEHDRAAIERRLDRCYQP